MVSKKVLATALALAATLALAACGSSSDSSSTASSADTTAAAAASGAETAAPAASEAAPAPTMDIVDTAVAAGSFTTLTKLLTDAGLVETLKGDGPFTVFAPTDEAFAKVDPATLEKLAANPEALKQVLTYHVLAGKVMAADVASGPVTMVSGDEATLTAEGGTVMIDKANVTTADVVATNGVIHVIDAVLIPAGLTL